MLFLGIVLLEIFSEFIISLKLTMHQQAFIFILCDVHIFLQHQVLFVILFPKMIGFKSEYCT